MTASNSSPIAIAGASGFVGSWLMRELGGDHRWIALSRQPRESDDANVEWRQADLYSLPNLTKALRGAKSAIYLVHSMLPSSRLVQGSFADLDLLLADNFARAAKEAGVEHIIYLGGLIPEGENAAELSEHLASRLEVEGVLRSYGADVSVLRSGMIYGRGGSSIRILLQLVRRLPVMILPKWTRNQTQATDVRDIVRAIEFCLTKPEFRGGTWDLASHEPMTYREMILQSAEVLGLRRLAIDFPANFIGLSKLWVATISQTSPSLVNPLLASLRHTMLAKPNALLDALTPDCTPFRQSVRDSVDESGRPADQPQAGQRRSRRQRIKKARRVRSVQRMPLPNGWNAQDVADAYGKWLTRSSGIVNVIEIDDGVLRFQWRWPRINLLELHPAEHTRHDDCRRVFYIRGGLLTRSKDTPHGRFEFRVVEDGAAVIAAIHEYAPRLPWHFYHATQARIHLLVMRAFARYLRRERDVERAR